MILGCHLLASFAVSLGNKGNIIAYEKINWDPKMATKDLMMHFRAKYECYLANTFWITHVGQQTLLIRTNNY
jgi:hypothetical protein